MTKPWLEKFVEEVRNSPDPLSTAFSYIVAYLYVSDISGHEVVAYLNGFTYEDAWRTMLGLGMIFIGHRSFKGGSDGA